MGKGGKKRKEEVALKREVEEIKQRQAEELKGHNHSLDNHTILFQLMIGPLQRSVVILALQSITSLSPPECTCCQKPLPAHCLWAYAKSNWKGKSEALKSLQKDFAKFSTCSSTLSR